MVQGVNWSTSKWFNSEDLPDLGGPASCRLRHDLPWIGEERPDPDTYDEMESICDSCVVKLKCAEYALSGANRKGHAATGGFYAGVWIPWPSDTSSNRSARYRAREALRRRLRNDVVVAFVSEKRRRGRPFETTTVHGTYGMYKNHNCRCIQCKAANKLYSRQWRETVRDARE